MYTSIPFGVFVLIIGIIAIMVAAAFIFLHYSNKQENRTKDIIRYGEYHIEKEWVSMLDLCRELISMDARRFEQIGKLFGDLPNMSQEQLKQEFAHMEDLKKSPSCPGCGKILRGRNTC